MTPRIEQSARTRKIRLREAVKLAEDHALGILESTDCNAFWGEEFFDEHSSDGEWRVLYRARTIVQNRLIRKAKP